MVSNSFSFGNINVAAKKQVLNLQTVSDIVLLDKSNAQPSTPFPVIILSDEIYNRVQLASIRLFLESSGLTSYKIVAALNCVMTKELIKEDQKSGLIDFYRCNSSNFWKEVPANAVIITVGSALYAVTKADDIYPNDTQQFIWGKSHFWYSRNQSEDGNWIYPIESFQAIFQYGFTAGAMDSYKTSLARFQIKAIRSLKNTCSPISPAIEKVFVDSTEGFDAFYEENKHRRNEILCFDLETSGFDFWQDRIGCIQLSFDGKKGYYIPWKFVNKRKLGALLQNNKQLGANLRFDVRFLWWNGISQARVDEDVVVLGHTMDETRSNSLKSLAYYYTTYGGYDEELEEYKRKVHIDNYLDIPEPILREYAVLDAIVTWQVFDNMLRHLREVDAKHPNEKGTKYTVEDYYRQKRIPSVNLFLKLEYRGVVVDTDKLAAARINIQNRINDQQFALANLFGVSKDFDFASPAELGKLLAKKGWENLDEVKRHPAPGEEMKFGTADYALEKWAQTHPEAKILQDFRSSRVMLNTFIGDKKETKGWSQYLVRHENGEALMHPSWGAMGTESGRTRCSAPNMMNVPTHGQFAAEIKACLGVPSDDEYYMVTIDYSGLQLRLAAADSQDPTMCKVFNSKNADIHSQTAYGIFIKGKRWKTETIKVKQNGKEYVFLGGQMVNTVNRGEIFATELVESDELVI